MCAIVLYSCLLLLAPLEEEAAEEAEEEACLPLLPLALELLAFSRLE